MKTWFQQHFTVGGMFTLVTAILTLLSVVGGLYVFADDIGETQEDVKALKVESKENTKHAERTDIHHTGERLVETFVTEPIFTAYKESQKQLDDQFQKQLFIQLERMEKKMDN